MPRRFGFDEAGLGFDLGPFSPNARDQLLELQAKTLPVQSSTAALGQRERFGLLEPQQLAPPVMSSTAALGRRDRFGLLEPQQTTLPVMSIAAVLVGRRDRVTVLETCVDVPLGTPDTYSTSGISVTNFFPFIPASVLVGARAQMILLDFRTNGIAAFQLHNGELLPSVETGMGTLRLIAANGTLELNGPDAPGNVAQDPDNLYDWSMGQPDRDRLGAWLASYTGGAVTLRICTAAVEVQARRVFATTGKFGVPISTAAVAVRASARQAITAERALTLVTSAVPLRKSRGTNWKLRQ